MSDQTNPYVATVYVLHCGTTGEALSIHLSQAGAELRRRPKCEDYVKAWGVRP